MAMIVYDIPTKILVLRGFVPESKISPRMCDVDENGSIDLKEMLTIVRSIYKMKGIMKHSGKGPEKKAKEIFRQMDQNSDGRVTLDEFVNTCMADGELLDFLAPQAL